MDVEKVNEFAEILKLEVISQVSDPRDTLASHDTIFAKSCIRTAYQPFCLANTQSAFTCSNVNNGSTRIIYQICSKLTIKTPEQSQWRCSSVFIVKFELILDIVLVLFITFLSVSIVVFEQMLARFILNYLWMLFSISKTIALDSLQLYYDVFTYIILKQAWSISNE